MNKVPLEEAIEQVRIAFYRLAQLHLSFSKTLVEEFGEDKGKELIIKSIMEYGKRIDNRSKLGHPSNPSFGIHGKYEYKGREYLDLRELLKQDSDVEFDLSSLKIYDCSLAEIFKESNEEELGRLYCYIDAAMSMSSDPNSKAVHTKCVLCGDDYCQIKNEETTEKEKKDFNERNKDWKLADSILL